MKTTFVLFVVGSGGVVGAYLYREAFGAAFIVIALLFGGSLALAGLHYFDLLREKRQKEAEIEPDE